MLRNLLISSWRSLHKNATSSLINFFGLLFGFTCILVIGIYIRHELSYDRYHKNAERIFRVTHNERAGEIPGIRHLATVGPPVGPALKETFSQVEDAVRFRYSPDRIMRVNDRQYYESRVFYVDPSVFHVFSFPLLEGNEKTALSLPNNVVITQEMATKYFGDESPIGQTIVMDNATNLTVSGVLASLPTNTHLKFDFLIPFEAFQVPYGFPVNLNSWGWISFHTYVLLKPGEDATILEKQLVNLVNKNWPQERAKTFKMELQPLTDIYLGDVEDERIASGNQVYIVVLFITGCFIMIVAGFNFANLYTVTSLTRAKEMGIRNVMGSGKTFIARYLFTESIAITTIAALVAIGALTVPLSYLKSIGFEYTMNSIQRNELFWITIGLAILTGGLAAISPVVMLSGVDQRQLIKGTFRTSSLGILVRRSLLLIEFCITIGLISSIMIINNQMDFIGRKDLGYAKDELILLRMPGANLAQRFGSIKAKLLQNPHVTQVSLGGGRMDGQEGNVPIYAEGHQDEGIPMAIKDSAFDFLKTIGGRLIAGREISEQLPADTLQGVLINESAAKTFGWTPEEALGKKIKVGEIVLDGKIIGVTSDFNFEQLRSSIQPLVMYYPRTHIQDIYVRFQPGTHLQNLVTSLQGDWRTVAPEFPFDFTFLGEYLNSLYKAEKFFFLLFKLFTVVAICISCLGLFALVSQDVLFRIKEIGIRKTLGASVGNILSLIVTPFVGLIVLAGLIATPLSWWGMKRWLDEFSYHTDITWNVFPLALLGTICLAIITVSYKAIKAGLKNPINSLKSE